MSSGHSPKKAGAARAAGILSLFAGLGDAPLPGPGPSHRSRHGTQENPIFIQHWDIWTIGGKAKDEPAWVPALPEYHTIRGYCAVMTQEYSTAGVVGVRDGVIETHCGFYRLGDMDPKVIQEYENDDIGVPTTEHVLDWLAKEVQ